VGAAVVGAAAAAETACKPQIIQQRSKPGTEHFLHSSRTIDVFLLAFLLLEIGTFTVLVLYKVLGSLFV
jgi:hypothetical protein